MPSKIKNFDFTGCQHLRKLLIDINVEAKGKIDLSDTPLKDKNDINSVDTKFKNIPDGITATPEFLRSKIKIKGETSEIGTQIDRIGDLGSLHLSEDDEKVINLMDDSLFWYTDFRIEGRKDYLEQRRNQLKDIINSDASEKLNDSIRLLAEHILLISEKILENSKYFDNLGNTANPSGTTHNKKKWSDFHKFLLNEVLDQDGINYKFKPVLNSAFGIDPTKLGEKALERFMSSLEATMDKDGRKYYTFPEYDDDWEFEDYYNRDTRYIGIKPYKINGVNNYVEKKISDGGEEILKKLFEYWKKFGVATSNPSTSISAKDYDNLKRVIKNMWKYVGGYSSKSDDQLYLKGLGIIN